MDEISVVHLVWRPLGPEVLSRFVAAYRRFPAGIPHRLVVLYNGFDGKADRGPFERILGGVDHEECVLSRPVQDLPAYLEAARAITSEHVCFLNSYSEPLAPDWLAVLHTHAARPGIGLVGASGSWESHHTITAQTLAQIHGGGPAAAARRVIDVLRRGPRMVKSVVAYAQFRRSTHAAARVFEPFPNHHIRTNGFMLRRELMVGLRWPAIRTKSDALAFESGRDGLTRQVEARGLATLVVGRDGEAFAPADWWRSGTYRSGDQHNLLIGDNRTRQYGEFDALDAETKARVIASTWGSDPASSGLVLARQRARVGA